MKKKIQTNRYLLAQSLLRDNDELSWYVTRNSATYVCTWRKISDGLTFVMRDITKDRVKVVYTTLDDNFTETNDTCRIPGCPYIVEYVSPSRLCAHHWRAWFDYDIWEAKTVRNRKKRTRAVPLC